jgi:hypothetical protein
MCLGSINFGTIEDIEPAVDKVVSLLKPQSQIFWRLNPGRQDHACGDCEQIKFFPWTHEILAKSWPTSMVTFKPMNSKKPMVVLLGFMQNGVEVRL